MDILMRPWFWVTLNKVIISVFALAYMGYLVVGLFDTYLGANPVEEVTHASGNWTLYFLCMTLAITPLRRHFHLNVLQQFRRFLGLWSFAFACLHFSMFIVFDHFFDWQSIVDDVLHRPYLALGFAAFFIMLPLALTSMQYWQRALGKRWLQLHRSVYVVAILAIMHYWWLVKADILMPLVFAGLVLVLFASRVYWRFRKYF